VLVIGISSSRFDDCGTARQDHGNCFAFIPSILPILSNCSR